MNNKINMTTNNFWSGKRVLITGHTGFKGSWLSIWLHSLGAKLYGLSLPPPTSPSLFEIAQVDRLIEHNIVDIRDSLAVKTHIENFQPEIIFHMAAQPLVRMSYSLPLETYATNIMGTAHVLEAARGSPQLRAIIVVTTDKCYENKEWIWGYRENEPLGGYDPYSSSKACTELVCAAYRQSFFKELGIGLATVRAGNVIGGGDWASDRLIPDVISSLQASKPIKIRHPLAIRPWQHVLEPLGGYLLLAENLFLNGQDNAEAWNFGPQDDGARSVEWVVKLLCKLWGNEASWINQDGRHPHEATFLKLDISKARQRLGWSPYWNIEKALEQTVEWYRAWIKEEDMHKFCLYQIQDYVSSL